jgi:hypothetical protein
MNAIIEGSPLLILGGIIGEAENWGLPKISPATSQGYLLIELIHPKASRPFPLARNSPKMKHDTRILGLGPTQPTLQLYICRWIFFAD